MAIKRVEINDIEHTNLNSLNTITEPYSELRSLVYICLVKQ